MSDGGAPPDRDAELLELRLRVEGLERELGATSTTLAVRTALLDARRHRRAVRALDRLAAVADAATAAGAVASGWTGLPDGGVRVPLAGLAPHASAEVAAWTDAIDVAGVSLGGAPADPPTRWAWALRDIPSGTVARAFAAVRPAAWAFNRGGVRFRLAVEGPDGTTRAEALRDVHPAARGADRAWVPLQLPVPTSDDDVVLVLSTALPPDAPPDFAWAVWGDPVLLVPPPGAGLGVEPLPGRSGRWRAAAAAARPRRAARAAGPAEGPSLTFLMPVHDPDPELLDATLRSVLAQADPAWRLCIADDGSRDPAVRARLQEAARDPRVDLQRHETAQGISAATNLALAHADGEFVATLDHDDLLTPDAVGAVRARLAARPELDVLYSDNDKVAGEVRFAPSLKPGWSPELLRACMYTLHLGVYRRALVEAAGGWRPAFDGAQDHDLLLRLSERTERIAHLPRTLYSWRAHEGSAALGDTVKAQAYDRGVAAVAEHLGRIGADAGAERLPQAGRYRVVYRPREDERIAVVAIGEPLPADAEIIVLPAAAAEPVDDDWAAELAGPLRLAGVAAAAPVVLDADGRVASAGLAIAGGLALPLFAGEAPDAHPELTMVTDRSAAGLVVAVRRAALERTPCDPTLGTLALADLTARLTVGGERVAVTPHAPWRLTGPVPATALGALRRFRDAHAGRTDPFVNPRLWPDRAAGVVPRALQQTGLLADLGDAG